MFGRVELLDSCHVYIERWWFECDGGHGSNMNFIKVDKTLLVLELNRLVKEDLECHEDGVR